MKSLFKKFRRYCHLNELMEAAYEGNIGAEEVMKFYMSDKATDAAIETFEDFLKRDDEEGAWKLLQRVMGTKLVGIPHDENPNIKINIMEKWRRILREAQSYPKGEKDDTDNVSKAIVLNKEKKILILKRASHMKWEPNKWDLPGGMIKKGETAKEAIKREIKEETGLTLTGATEVGNVNKIIIFKGKVKTEDLSPLVELDDENNSYKWISAEQSSEYDFVPFLKDFITEE